MANREDVERAIKENSEACKRQDRERKGFQALVQKNVRKVLAEQLELTIQPYGQANYVYALRGETPRTRCIFDNAKLKSIGPLSTTSVDGIIDREILYECSRDKSHRYCLPPTLRELKQIEKAQREIRYAKR